MARDSLVDWSLRIAVAFAFLFPPLSAFFSPYDWVGYFPSFMRGFVPDMVMLHTFGVLEAILAFWILSGRRVFYPASIAAAILLAIVVLDFADFEVLFRDVSIMLSALALAILHRPGAKVSSL